MTAPIHHLPPVEEIASLPKRSQIAYAIRCALRAEPLYAEQDTNPIRARFVHANIETAIRYFLIGRYDKHSASIDFNPSFQDYGVEASVFAAMASEDAFDEVNDPEYDTEMAAYDEATPAHRVECVATFSLLAAADTHLPAGEADRIQRIALAAALADFQYLTQHAALESIDEIGPLWHNAAPDTFDRRLAGHNRMLIRK